MIQCDTINRKTHLDQFQDEGRLPFRACHVNESHVVRTKSQCRQRKQREGREKQFHVLIEPLHVDQMKECVVDVFH